MVRIFIVGYEDYNKYGERFAGLWAHSNDEAWADNKHAEYIEEAKKFRTTDGNYVVVYRDSIYVPKPVAGNMELLMETCEEHLIENGWDSSPSIEAREVFMGNQNQAA